MMKLLYEELRENVREIGKENKKENNSAQHYFEAIKNICIAEQLANKKGLLALDPNPEYGEITQYISDDETLMKVMELIVDGTDADLIMEVMFTEYFTRNFRGNDAIIFLLKLVGGLSIQAGNHPNLLRKKLEAMVPAQYYDEYKALYDEYEIRSQKTYEEKMDEKLHDLCDRSVIYLDHDKLYLANLVLDQIFENASEEDIKKILRKVDSADLAFVLKLMSGIATEKIFNSISKRTAYLVIEKMDMLGTISLSEIEEKKNSILNAIVNQILAGELNADHFSFLMQIVRGTKMSG